MTGLSLDDIAKLILTLLAWLVVWLLPFCGLWYGAYFLITLPLRRQERARFFLDLIETALRQGRPTEPTLVAISGSRDTSMGARFHLLAAYLETGLRLSQALERVPRLLPPQIAAMLEVGEQIGDLSKVLPACRQLLRDATSHLRAAVNYIAVLVFLVTPGGILVMHGMLVYVFPRFRQVLEGLEAEPSAWLAFLWRHESLLAGIQVSLLFLFWLAAFFYIGGPRVVAWLQAGVAPALDWLFHQMPWRRKRMQRDLAAMLAILLDADLPEAEAVTLAARCTANAVFKRRARRAVEGLKQGMKLTEALEFLDDSGEFRWRLTHACYAHGGFFRALAGWHEALDAKAYQQEQAAAQLIAVCLLLFNAAFVALMALAAFGSLTAIVEAGVLW